VICAVSIFVAVVTVSVSLSASDLPTADALMLRLMSRYNVPGASLVLIKDGRIVLERGCGLRDLEANAPVTTAPLFDIGSISKSFTALGIAQLADQHQVDLNTPSSDIPDLQLTDRETPNRSRGPAAPVDAPNR
jgi:CubicO group peptidase (beta-lactamase class C family)